MPKINVHHQQSWAAFLATRLTTTRNYARCLETRIQHLTTDLYTGWIAAAMLLITLAIVLYQWLGHGVPTCQM